MQVDEFHTVFDMPERIKIFFKIFIMYFVFFLVKSTKTARGSLNLLCQPKNKRPSLLPRALILLTKLMIGVDAGDYRTEIESLHRTFSNSLYVGSKFIAWMKDRKGGLVNVPYSYQL